MYNDLLATLEFYPVTKRILNRKIFQGDTIGRYSQSFGTSLLGFKGKDGFVDARAANGYTSYCIQRKRTIQFVDPCRNLDDGAWFRIQ
mgnify:CR=1 FL=1